MVPADDRPAGQPGDEAEGRREDRVPPGRPVAHGDEPGSEVSTVQDGDTDRHPDDQGEDPEQQNPQPVRPVRLDAAGPAER